MNQDVGFSSEREGLIHTNVPKALTQVLELDLQVYVIFVLAERATGMLFKEKPIYQIGEGCSGGNTDHQDSSPRVNLIISGTAMQWQVSTGEMDLAHPGTSEMRRDKGEGPSQCREWLCQEREDLGKQTFLHACGGCWISGGSPTKRKWRG